MTAWGPGCARSVQACIPTGLAAGRLGAWRLVPDALVQVVLLLPALHRHQDAAGQREQDQQASAGRVPGATTVKPPSSTSTGARATSAAQRSLDGCSTSTASPPAAQR